MSQKSGKGVLKKTPKYVPKKSIGVGSEKQTEKVLEKVTEEIPTQEGENPTQEDVFTKPVKIKMTSQKRGVLIKGGSIPDSPNIKKRKALEVL